MKQSLYHYAIDGKEAVSGLENLPLPPGTGGTPELFLVRREPVWNFAAWRVTDSRQLTAEQTGAVWLDPRRMGPLAELPPEVRAPLEAGRLTAVNLGHPRWRRALEFTASRPGKKRVHLLAVGDVGGVLLTALKLLGGDVISTVGICDLNENTVARWVTEMGQIAWPWDYDALPEVEAVEPGRLFDCDVFIFAAARAVPPVGSGVKDVRMAQLEANRPLVESFARQARTAGFRGLFMVLSDPVDQLCQAAWWASNVDAETEYLDLQGLLPEQIQGFGLGVMNARAAWFAGQDPRFASFLTEGRSFGPHGAGLVIANSVERYDDALSRELTRLTLEANLRVRDLGFKPYVAPAVSSGAIQLLLALRGKWHCSSVPLGGVWFGCKNRFTRFGLDVETLELPDDLFDRLRETEAALHAMEE